MSDHSYDVYVITCACCGFQGSSEDEWYHSPSGNSYCEGCKEEAIAEDTDA